MHTWEVIKFLVENPNTDKVFISRQQDKVYDIYLNMPFAKEFMIDERPIDGKGWIYKTELKNYELNNLLWIDNWE